MIGTLWRNRYSEILVCMKYEDGFLHLTYMEAPEYKSCSHESNIHKNYTQLTQPTEKK